MKKILLLILLPMISVSIFLPFMENENRFTFSSITEFKKSELFSWYIDNLPDDSHNLIIDISVEANQMILIFDSMFPIKLTELDQSRGYYFFWEFDIPISNVNNKDVFCFFDQSNEAYLVNKNLLNNGKIRYILIKSEMNRKFCTNRNIAIMK